MGSGSRVGATAKAETKAGLGAEACAGPRLWVGDEIEVRPGAEADI